MTRTGTARGSAPTPGSYKLGRLLVEREWLTADQLSAGLKHQMVFGGRLGTCLLELNLISEERLAKALCEQHGLPSARLEDLRTIPPAVLELIPARMACRSKVVPFQKYGTELSVVMLDVRDLMTQDELAFVTSKRVRLHVAPEVRILEALEKHYGLEVEVRFTRIWDRLNRALYLWQEDGKSQVSAAQVSPLREPAAADSGSWQPLPPPLLSEPSPGGDAAAREAAAAMGPAATAPPMAPPEPPPAPVEAPPEPVPAATEKSGPVTRPVEVPEPPRTLAELDARLDEAEEREEIALTALEFFHQHFERVLLFMVRGAEAAAWMGSGEGVDQQLLASFRLGFDEPSLFLNLREGSPFFRGPLPRMEAHQRLARLWGGKMPRESVLLPVRVKQRLVAVVYGDRGGRDLAGLDLELMQQAAARVGAALQEFIARRKRGG